MPYEAARISLLSGVPAAFRMAPFWTKYTRDGIGYVQKAQSATRVNLLRSKNAGITETSFPLFAFLLAR